jgi:hypothetical protein
MILLLAWGVGMGASPAGAGTPSTPAGTLPLMGVGR